MTGDGDYGVASVQWGNESSEREVCMITCIYMYIGEIWRDLDSGEVGRSDTRNIRHRDRMVPDYSHDHLGTQRNNTSHKAVGTCKGCRVGQLVGAR